MRRFSLALVGHLAVVMLTAGCGSTPSAPSPAATISIGPSGISPKQVRIKAWNYVMFTNNDSRTHTILSDPVDVHTQCPALNRVGVLLPGESRETATLNLAGRCGFHDHGDPSDSAFQGLIIIE